MHYNTQHHTMSIFLLRDNRHYLHEHKTLSLKLTIKRTAEKQGKQAAILQIAIGMDICSDTL